MEFGTGVPSDKGDEWHLTIESPEGETLYDMVFNCPTRGLHLTRNTPELRNFLDVAQAAVDAGDPVNYAPHMIFDPLPGNGPKNVLVTVNIQDWTVPAATGVAFGRAAGLVSLDRNARLAQIGIMTGLTDVDYETANDPVESSSLYGFRLHPGGNHAYLYWPSFWDPDKMLYTFAVREQMAIFFETNGQVIEDDLGKLLEGYALP